MLRSGWVGRWRLVDGGVTLCFGFMVSSDSSSVVVIVVVSCVDTSRLAALFA